MNKNSNKANQGRFAAMRLAEINATDKEDFQNCANDMEKTASLDANEAVVVARAIRAKYLPNIAKQAGLDVSNLDLDHGKETVDFANDESDDEEEDMEFHHFESDENEDVEEDDMSDEDVEDEDEVEDSDDVATFEIEVPADMVDQAQQAVQKALDDLLGGDDDSDEDDDEDVTHFNDDEDVDSEDESDDEEETQFMKKSNEVRSMTKQALAERKAQREALLRRAEREEILKKIASEEETYPAHSSFKYNEDLVDMEGEVDYPSMSMDNSEGNSLKEQNPTWAEQKVPTMNADSLEFPSVTKPMKFEGSGDGSLEYTVDWNKLENPSEGLEDAEHPAIPTQMPSMPHKTTKTVAASKEEHDVECTACGHTMRMSEAAMEDPSTRCANKECPTNAESEEREVEAQNVDTNTHVKTQKKINDTQVELSDAFNTVNQLKQSAVDVARIKTSYSCATKLALAGIITSDEVDSYAEQMINDGLKSDSMIRQTKLLLKSAQSSTERVAAAAAERMSTRTASTLGVSTSPAFSGNLSANSAALDIQSALKGAFTMPKIED